MTAKVARLKLKSVSGTADVYGFERRISYGRALAEGIGLCLGMWIVTLPTIFIPILHLVSVPTGIFGGVAVAIIMYRKRGGRCDIVGGTSKCPKCGKDIRLTFVDVRRQPANGVCLQCSEAFELDTSLPN